MADAKVTHLSLRLQLLKDGYVPLKNTRKKCFEKGWSTVKVDEALIESWEPHPRAKVLELTTGVRCDGLAAIDIDVDDPDLIADVVDLMDEIGITSSAPERVGNPAHQFFVYRADAHLKHKIQTGRYLKPGFEGAQAVEILAGSGCQFGAFGRYNDLGDYAWPGAHLMGTPLKELPVLTAKQANELIEGARKVFEAAGLERPDPIAGANGADFEVVEDLTPDMEVTLEDGGALTVADMEGLAYGGRCCMSFIRANADNPTAGLISPGADGRVMITDFVTGLVHTTPLEALQAVSSVSPALAALQRPRGPSSASPGAYSMDNRPSFDRSVLPDVMRTAGGNARQVQPATLGNVKAAMEAMDIVPTTNMMTGDVEFLGDFAEGVTAANVRAMIVDACGMAGVVGRENIDERINLIAHHQSYHPMADWITSVPWDGKARFAELIDTTLLVATQGERPARDIYARRWAIQVVEGVVGRRETQKAGVWILIGDQGIGKTQWFKRFVGGDAYFNEGQELHLEGFASSRDGLIAATTKPVTELGEVETTFGRSNQNSLKNLISRAVDSWRPPYGRHIEYRPRMTSFCATANTHAFLMDASGSRRYWPIECRRCDFEGLSRYDMQQVWAEVHSWWQSGEVWWLTEVEDELRQSREGDFEQDDETRETLKRYLERVRAGRWHSVAKSILEIADALQLRKGPADLSRLRSQLESQVGREQARFQTRTRVWAFPVRRGAVKKQLGDAT